MSVALDTPSQINYQRPYFGGTLDWVGKAEAAIIQASKAVLNPISAVGDYTDKTPAALQTRVITVLTGGLDQAYSAAGQAAVDVASVTGKVVSPISTSIGNFFSGVGSFFSSIVGNVEGAAKWGIIAVVAIAVIYALNTARAFVPRSA